MNKHLNKFTLSINHPGFTGMFLVQRNLFFFTTLQLYQERRVPQIVHKCFESIFFTRYLIRIAEKQTFLIKKNQVGNIITNLH